MLAPWNGYKFTLGDVKKLRFAGTGDWLAEVAANGYCTLFAAKWLKDVNGDESVNIVDVTSVISYILGHSPSTFRIAAADVNGDGVVNIVDVTSIIDAILNKK